MSLRYSYQLIPVQQPVVALGGRWVRPRSIVTVSLMGPAATYAGDAHLDTAADDCVFPEHVAARVGLELANAPAGTARGVGLAPVPVRFAQVVLRLTDGRERREWPGWVGFTPVRMPYALLGFGGCLQFFTATFRGDREEVELTVNGLYPGT